MNTRARAAGAGLRLLRVGLLGCLLAGPAQAAPRAITEVHLQLGTFDTPDFQGGGKEQQFIATLQHAGKWSFGDVFLFVDFQNLDGPDKDIYSEFYVGFSLSKLTKRKISFGPIRDIGLRMGLNYGADANILRVLPGLRLSWDLPGFRYLNTDFYAFLDASGGIASGGAPKQTNSINVDINWSRPFRIGGARFSIEGHVEYAGNRRNELGTPVSWWILGQPQFRFDLGQALTGRPDKMFIGIEWQFWINKQGERQTDEQVVQALAVWRF